MATSKQKMENRKGGMKTPPVVSPQEWQVARQQLLVKEKALTRSRDALAAERRRMPWMAVEKKYEFDGPKGKVSLLDLFEGRRQLIVYRAFFEPGVFGWPEHACRGCSLGADQVAHLAHLNARDTTLAPPYKWWNWHDNYDAEASPAPKWVEVSDAGEAAFRKRDAQAKTS